MITWVHTCISFNKLIWLIQKNDKIDILSLLFMPFTGNKSPGAKKGSDEWWCDNFTNIFWVKRTFTWSKQIIGKSVDQRCFWGLSNICFELKEESKPWKRVGTPALRSLYKVGLKLMWFDMLRTLLRSVARHIGRNVFTHLNHI